MVSGNIVKIDFAKHKELLDAILLLPDSAFSSWDWKLHDRQIWYNEIKENNSYTDNEPNFFNQTYLAPNSMKFIIVDGSWSVSLYKTSDNSSFVITDDIVGDGNEICIYELKSNKILKTVDVKSTFGNYFELIRRDDPETECLKKYDEIDRPIFSFNFSEQQTVEIESSWSLIQDEYSECLKGNSLLYKFNPDKKKFDLEKIYWKPKTDD